MSSTTRSKWWVTQWTSIRLRRRFVWIKILATAVLGTGALSTLFAHRQASTTHTVRSGESLWSISHHYGITVSKLKSLNGLSSNLIFPNQVLKVSGSSNYSSRSNYGNSSSTYTVRAGIVYHLSLVDMVQHIVILWI